VGKRRFAAEPLAPRPARAPGPLLAPGQRGLPGRLGGAGTFSIGSWSTWAFRVPPRAGVGQEASATRTGVGELPGQVQAGSEESPRGGVCLVGSNVREGRAETGAG